MKHIIFLLVFTLFSYSIQAQKIYLGSCYTHDKGMYKGEMSGGKPHGKGSTVFANGDTFEGEYVKGRRMERSMRDNGFKTNSMGKEPTIS